MPGAATGGVLWKKAFFKILQHLQEAPVNFGKFLRFLHFIFMNHHYHFYHYFHTFTVNSHADNHFYKYIYLFQILYSLKSDFLIKIYAKILTKVFYIQIWFKCETPLLYFLIRAIVYRKKTLEKTVFLL